MRRIASDLNNRGIIGKRRGRFLASTIRAILENSLHADSTYLLHRMPTSPSVLTPCQPSADNHNHDQ